MILLFAGCAHVISKDLRAKADPSLTFKQVLRNPEAYKNRTVIWGGEIVRTLNQKDGTTLVEVFQKPLGWRGEPKDGGLSDGRFLILVEKYLDPYLFRRGRKITAAGEILGEKIRPLGEMDYRYPLLLGKEIHLWAEYYYYPGPYYYDPWWGFPYGWGYPYRWGYPYGPRFHLYHYGQY
jgi:outer membrane lipoprotein